MPFENTNRSPRFANCRGKNRSRASKLDSRGKSAKAVFAARTRIAAVAAWTRTRSTEDPWAEPWEPATDSGHSTETLRARAHEAREDLTVKVGDAAETVGEVAGVTVAKSREATRKAADKVTAAAEELTEKVSEAREDLTEKVADAAKTY